MVLEIKPLAPTLTVGVPEKVSVWLAIVYWLAPVVLKVRLPTLMGVPRLQGHDIQDLDFQNPDEVASWINLNYQELFDASATLGI